jgi:hypothetical protein
MASDDTDDAMEQARRWGEHWLQRGAQVCVKSFAPFPDDPTFVLEGFEATVGDIIVTENGMRVQCFGISGDWRYCSVRMLEPIA